MYRSIDDFLTDWKYETDSTLKVFALISDDKAKEKISVNIRSLATLGWHLTQTLTEMGTKAGLFDEDALEHLPVPTMREIAETYRKYAELIGKAVRSRWTDSSLPELKDMYGDQWQKAQILRILINHQAHHRGQMTTIMRMLDLKVPGLYGPSKEEWAEFGMTAPE